MLTVAPTLSVTRRPERFVSDDRRVITRFFSIGGEHRERAVVERVMQLDEPAVEELLAKVMAGFGARHRDIATVFEGHFEQVRAHVAVPGELSPSRRQLIGSYFTMEYSIESAALFNPSIVLHPDQSAAGPGEARFIMSLRATGEGHISSIVFRTGTLDAQGHTHFDPPSRFASRMRVRHDRDYDKKVFTRKLAEMGACADETQAILDTLPAHFTFEALDRALAAAVAPDAPALSPLHEAAENMRWLARSNYHLHLPPDTDPAEIVIFPTSDNECKGIEDVRLTRFVDDDGSVTYFGTYTAYNGQHILPQLLETRDFSHIAIHTLNGQCAQNKGMALFPRRIDGQYHMISRLDGENMFLMRSDNIHFWNDCQPLQTPRYPWEFIQVGNCGAPIETEAGWILLTHGVGPMRQYCIGATLLDLDDPSRIIGHLDEPLLVPDETERDGYVPNVVYSCGAVLHHGQLVIPYAVSDSATTFASLDVNPLLEAMLQNGGL